MLERSGTPAGEYLEVSRTTAGTEDRPPLNKTDFSAERAAPTETKPMTPLYGNGKPRRVKIRGNISSEQR